MFLISMMLFQIIFTVDFEDKRMKPRCLERHFCVYLSLCVYYFYGLVCRMLAFDSRFWIKENILVYVLFCLRLFSELVGRIQSSKKTRFVQIDNKRRWWFRNAIQLFLNHFRWYIWQFNKKLKHLFWIL